MAPHRTLACCLPEYDDKPCCFQKKKTRRALHPEESFEILDCTRIYKALQIRIALSLNRVGLFSAYNRHNHQETSNVQNSGVRPMHFRLVGAIGPEKTFFSCSQDWIAVSMRAFFGNHCRGIPFARSVYHWMTQKPVSIPNFVQVKFKFDFVTIGCDHESHTNPFVQRKAAQ